MAVVYRQLFYQAQRFVLDGNVQTAKFAKSAG
jgi:hypothetical protein